MYQKINLIFFLNRSHLTGHWSLLLKKENVWYLGNDKEAFVVTTEDMVSKCLMFMYTKAEQVDVSF